MRKSIFISKTGEVHIATIAIDGYRPMQKNELDRFLKKLKGKKFWRCHICNDLFIGKIPPKLCATCKDVESYVQINEKELRYFIKIFFSRSLSPGMMDLGVALSRPASV